MTDRFFVVRNSEGDYLVQDREYGLVDAEDPSLFAVEDEKYAGEVCALFEQMADGTINLAEAELETVELFEMVASCSPYHAARALFKGRTDDEAKKALKVLESYAHVKALAVRERLEGDIESADNCEWVCAQGYQKLPDWARPWLVGRNAP